MIVCKYVYKYILNRPPMNYQEDPFIDRNKIENNLNSGLEHNHDRDRLKCEIKEQDIQLDHLHSSLQQVRHQTTHLHTELNEHNELLDRLGHRMEITENGLEGVGRKVRKLYGELTDRKFTWTASALIFLLTILLFFLIFL